MIAGERPAATVRAMLAGSQADDEEARLGVAERRHRACSNNRAAAPHRIEKRREPRTAPAIRIEDAAHAGIGAHGLGS